MGNGRNGGGSLLLALGVVLVLYYGFHMDGLGWILKTAFAGVILFVALVIAGTAYLIWHASKKRKEKLQEREQGNMKGTQAAAGKNSAEPAVKPEDAEAEAERREQESLRKIRESRGQ